jgi:hypothetical protein
MISNAGEKTAFIVYQRFGFGVGVDIILIDILTIANISVICSFCFERFENGKRDEVQDYKENTSFGNERG